MPELDTWQWILGGLAALLIGIAKTGVPGIGVFIVPLMVFAVGDARYAAAWTVVLLIMGDIVAVSYWRRHARIRRLWSLIPWVAIGMAGGAAALALPEPTLRRIVGVIILMMVGLSVLRTRRAAPAGENAWVYGIPAGFATTVANAAGPVMNLYLLAQRLAKEEFIATAAWFFFVVNVSKIPIYTAYGLFTRESLTFNLVMAPMVVMGSVAGVWLVRRISQRFFNTLIRILTLAAAVALLF